MKNMKKCLALLLALLLALSLAACGGDSSPPPSMNRPPPSRIWSRIPLSTPTTAAFWALG